MEAEMMRAHFDTRVTADVLEAPLFLSRVPRNEEFYSNPALAALAALADEDLEDRAADEGSAPDEEEEEQHTQEDQHDQDDQKPQDQDDDEAREEPQQPQEDNRQRDRMDFTMASSPPSFRCSPHKHDQRQSRARRRMSPYSASQPAQRRSISAGALMISLRLMDSALGS